MIEQTALIRHCVNELFGFEPKNKQIEAIRHLLYDKRDLVLNAHCQNRLKLGKALKYLPGTPPDPGIVEAGKLNYYALARGAGWNTKHTERIAVRSSQVPRTKRGGYSSLGYKVLITWEC